MPDPMLILKAMGAAAGVAAMVPLLCGWPWRTPYARTSAGWVLGVGAGFYLGCWLLGLWPHWPPAEDQDRFLLLVLPAVIGAELVAAIPFVPWWLAVALRLTVAAGAARVLLDHTTYITDLGVPGTPEWSPTKTWLVLRGSEAALAVAWAALIALANRAPGRSLPLALGLTCAGAGVAIMLSGYSTGGQLGLPLAAALAGVAFASFALSGPQRVNGVLGVGLVGLFSLLVIGHFLANLTETHVALLLAAPLLCWLPELPYIRRLRPWVIGLLRVALVAVPVVIVVIQAQKKFVEESRSSSPSPTEPSIQDYMDFGK